MTGVVNGEVGGVDDLISCGGLGSDSDSSSPEKLLMNFALMLIFKILHLRWSTSNWSADVKQITDFIS